MSFNPTTCPLLSKYYAQEFNTVGAPPVGWNLEIPDPASIQYAFESTGFRVWAFTDDGLHFGHTARLIESVDTVGIDFTKTFELSFSCEAGINSAILVKGISGWSTLYFGFGMSFTGVPTYYAPLSSGPLDPGIADDGVAVVRLEKYEVGATGQCRLHVNGVVVYDGGINPLTPWVSSSAGLYTETSRSSTYEVVGNTTLKYLYLIHEDAPSDCLGEVQVGASASVDRGIAPLGVQFTDTSEIG